MSKFSLENLDPNDAHSINISVYKPDGILSFWNWFTRRDKKDSQRKNIKFKINKEDLDKIKSSGFNFQKLQNVDLSNKNKFMRKGNVFTIPKTDLDPFLIKSLHPGTKTYVKRLISKSTISIRSKESCANLSYIRTLRSQKSVVNSKTSFKVNMRSNTNVNEEPRNVFLKSVPTTILKSNTKKLLIVGNIKSHKGNRTARTNTPEALNYQPHAKQNSNVIPMLLTRMKSMEEQLSDIENTTKQINQAVSQRNVITKTNSQNDLSSTERNRQKVVKCVASHKIYSKNINAPRKNKKNRSKKLRNQSKTNVFNPKEAHLKLKSPNKGFAFNYFSDSSNEFKHALGHSGICNNIKPGLVFNQNGFALPDDISKLKFSPENSNNVGCDLLMSVVKALTETKGTTNLQRTMGNSSIQNTNPIAEVGVINVSRSNLLSKSTFDWKHTSASTASEPHISETAKSNHDFFKVKENTSATFREKYVSSLDPCERNDVLKQLFDPLLQKQIVLELLRNNKQSLPVGLQTQDETMSPVDTVTASTLMQTTHLPNQDLKLTECKQGNDDQNIDEGQNPDVGFQKKASTQSCLYKEKSLEEDGSDVSIDGGAGTLCSVSVKQSAVSSAFPTPPGKQFKRTTISCAKEKKEPKVSITILVQDNMKSEVEMKSNLLKSSSVSKDGRLDHLLKQEEFSSPLCTFGPRGDELSTAYKPESVRSFGNLSSASCAVSDKKAEVVPDPKITVVKDSISRAKENFCVEVEGGERQTLAEQVLNVDPPGKYLNRAKRKVLDEKVLGFKQNSNLLQTVYEKEPLPPARSCSNVSNNLTSFDHLIETSFIRQETSYSKTKFNVCKENKYNSRTSLKPSESCKRYPFSDESLGAENNFDISTKYTSQQCVMYCRNNNVTKFRSKFPIFKDESSLKITEYKQTKHPFVVVHDLSTNTDDAVINKNIKSTKSKAKGVVSNICEDLILEVSEDDSEAEDSTLSKQQKEENSSIEVKKSSTSLRNSLVETGEQGSDINTLVDMDRLNRDRTDQREQEGASEDQHEDEVPTETNLQCEESKDAAGLTTNERRNRRGITTLTSPVHCSTLVQTDWSLVGITNEHLNYSSSTHHTRTVASQTDVTADQLVLISKELRVFDEFIKKSNQFSELEAYNVTLSQTNCLLEAVKHNNHFDSNKHHEEMEIADSVDVIKDPNGIDHTTGTLLNEEIWGSNIDEQMETAILSSSNRCLKLASEYYGQDKSVNVVHKDLPHFCTIPCLTTLSDETVTSSLSESSYKEHYLKSLPMIAINRGTCSYSKPLSPIEGSMATKSDSNSDLCSQLREFDCGDEGSHHTDEESQTSAAEEESIVCHVNELDVLEDGDRQVVEPASKTKQGNEVNKVQGRRCGFKKHAPTKVRQRECCFSGKCREERMMKYLSLEYRKDVNKGNSVFSET